MTAGDCDRSTLLHHRGARVSAYLFDWQLSKQRTATTHLVHSQSSSYCHSVPRLFLWWCSQRSLPGPPSGTWLVRELQADCQWKTFQFGDIVVSQSDTLTYLTRSGKPIGLLAGSLPLASGRNQAQAPTACSTTLPAHSTPCHVFRLDVSRSCPATE